MCPTLGIIADIKVFTRQLLAALPQRQEITAARFAPWLAQVQAWQAQWEAFVRPHFSDSTSPLRPEFVVGTLHESIAR